MILPAAMGHHGGTGLRSANPHGIKFEAMAVTEKCVAYWLFPMKYPPRKS